MRVCSECGKIMFEGYCINNGEEYYCGIVCLNKHYTDAEYKAMYNNGHGDSYWTDWEEGVTPADIFAEEHASDDESPIKTSRIFSALYQENPKIVDKLLMALCGWGYKTLVTKAMERN